MTKSRGVRHHLPKAGAAAIAVGSLLAVGATATATAGAAPGDHGGGPAQQAEQVEITICHRTNDVGNPYNELPVSVDSTDGSLGNGMNDHAGHLGPVFDFTADTSDADYPYAPPMNDDDWGDIIPPYSWEGGSFPGLNWTDDGQAIHAAHCTDPAVVVTDDEQTGGDVPGGDVPGGDVPGGDVPGGDVPGGDVPGGDVPGGDVPGGDEAGDDIDIDQPVMIENDAPADDEPVTTGIDTSSSAVEQGGSATVAAATQHRQGATEVLGMTIRRDTLPQTGTDVSELLLVGFGLILLGAGALVAGGSRTATA